MQLILLVLIKDFFPCTRFCVNIGKVPWFFLLLSITKKNRTGEGGSTKTLAAWQHYSLIDFANFFINIHTFLLQIFITIIAVWSTEICFVWIFPHNLLFWRKKKTFFNFHKQITVLKNYQKNLICWKISTTKTLNTSLRQKKNLFDWKLFQLFYILRGGGTTPI